MPMSNKPKSYTSEASAKSAIKKQGISGVPHRIAVLMTPKGRRYEPVFKPELAEDRTELRSRGWSVE